MACPTGDHLDVGDATAARLLKQEAVTLRDLRLEDCGFDSSRFQNPQPSGGARDWKDAVGERFAPKEASTTECLISQKSTGRGGCAACGTNEVASRDAEKQIGQWSSSSASFAGFEAAAFAGINRCQPPAGSEPARNAKSRAWIWPNEAASCRIRASIAR